jgi:hypothetical protein
MQHGPFDQCTYLFPSVLFSFVPLSFSGTCNAIYRSHIHKSINGSSTTFCCCGS